MVRVHIPYIVRDLTHELERITGLRLGVPVSAIVPPPPDDGQEVEAIVHLRFGYGLKFTASIRTRRGHYGQHTTIKSFTCEIKRGLDQEINMDDGWFVSQTEVGDHLKIVKFSVEPEPWVVQIWRIDGELEEDDAQFLT